MVHGTGLEKVDPPPLKKIIEKKEKKFWIYPLEYKKNMINMSAKCELINQENISISVSDNHIVKLTFSHAQR